VCWPTCLEVAMPSTEFETAYPPSYVTELLEEKVAQYNKPDFILFDPISIPHRFSIKQDIEIMGFWASVLAWGQRKTIINKCLELSALMDNAPYDFILNHQENDLKPSWHSSTALSTLLTPFTFSISSRNITNKTNRSNSHSAVICVPTM
jgi:hypothetical protein